MDLLSKLCSICHADPPKYRCPACHTRTCSLPCVSLHKSRGCTGLRDPTAYIKPSALRTPAGVDHDYNFLTGIELSRSRSETGLQSRAPAILGGPARDARLNALGFRERVRQTGVLIEYAPVGMERMRCNLTRFVKNSKRICWTVEWVLPDGSRTMDSLFDTDAIDAAYRSLCLRRAGKKRKRGADPSSFGQPSGKCEPSLLITARSECNSSARESIAKKPPSPLRDELRDEEHQSKIPLGGRRDYKTPAAEPSGTDEIAPIPDPPPSPPPSPPPAPAPCPPSEEVCSGVSTRSKNTTRPFFYLHKPLTPSSDRVLVPLPPSSTLLSALRGRTVLEFPTIHVLEHGPDELPAGFARDHVEAHDTATCEGQLCEGDAPKADVKLRDAAGSENATQPEVATEASITESNAGEFTSPCEGILLVSEDMQPESDVEAVNGNEGACRHGSELPAESKAESAGQTQSPRSKMTELEQSLPAAQALPGEEATALAEATSAAVEQVLVPAEDARKPGSAEVVKAEEIHAVDRPADEVVESQLAAPTRSQAAEAAECLEPALLPRAMEEHEVDGAEGGPCGLSC